MADYAVVLAGGGCRTVWAMGALEGLGLSVGPTEWAGVSAGAAMALFSATGRVPEVIDWFVRAATANRRNFYPAQLFKRAGRAFPHERIYRDALAFALEDGGFEALKKAAPVRTLLAYVKPGNSALPAALRALRDYERRKKAGIVLAPDEPPEGFDYEVITLQDCDRAAIIDHVLTSSATWPVTTIPRREGRTYVDGGLVDNVPHRALSTRAAGGKVLTLLSRTYPKAALPKGSPNRFFLAPSDPIPVKKWDYTSPDKLKATYELGRRDGRLAASQVRDWAGDRPMGPREEPGLSFW